MTVTLTLSPFQGDFRVHGTHLFINRRADGFSIDSYHTLTRRWLDRRGLTDTAFMRRYELLDVLAAHVAAGPPPPDSTPIAELRRRPDGSHITPEGDYVVLPRPTATPDSSIRPGWTVRANDPASLDFDTATLRHAAEIIAQLRQSDNAGGSD